MYYFLYFKYWVSKKNFGNINIIHITQCSSAPSDHCAMKEVLRTRTGRREVLHYQQKTPLELLKVTPTEHKLLSIDFKVASK
jgi:hypothetical protein